jgi:hypothetical protein
VIARASAAAQRKSGRGWLWLPPPLVVVPGVSVGVRTALIASADRGQVFAA